MIIIISLGIEFLSGGTRFCASIRLQGRPGSCSMPSKTLDPISKTTDIILVGVFVVYAAWHYTASLVNSRGGWMLSENIVQGSVMSLIGSPLRILVSVATRKRE